MLKQVIAIYINAFRWNLQNLRLWFWNYLGNLILALAVAAPLMSLLETTLGNTLASRHLMEGFDYSVYSDFMNEYGESILPILSQSQLVIGLYFILSIFLLGGILSYIKQIPQQLNFSQFLSVCARYFWKYFGLTLVFLVVHGLIAFMIWMLYRWSVNGFDLKYLDSELVIYARGRMALVGYLLIGGMGFMLHDYAKVALIHQEEPKVFEAVKAGFRCLRRAFAAASVLYLLYFLVFLALTAIYWNFSGDDLNSTSMSIWLTFLLGQLFIFFRIGLKIHNLTTASLLFQEHHRGRSN